MQALLKFSRAVDWLNAQVGKVVIWFIFGATLVSAGNALVRKIFGVSSNALLEVQWYLFAWSFLMAAGYTLLHREHVRIDVLNSRFSRRTQVWIDVLGFALFLTPICLVVLYLCTPVLLDKFHTGEMSVNTGGLVRWPVWAALPVAFALLLLQGLSELIKRVAFLCGQGPDPMGRLSDAGSDAQALAEAIRKEQEQAQSTLAAAQTEAAAGRQGA